MPLYKLAFLKEPNCLSDNTMEVISEYGDYYFSQGGTYLSMYGCSRDSSLLPRYITCFSVHKEVVKQVLLNGVGNFLHEMKKENPPPLHFCTGGYKFSKVKGVDEFVKALETFHFGEIFFQGNENIGKVIEHCVSMKIH